MSGFAACVFFICFWMIIYCWCSAQVVFVDTLYSMNKSTKKRLACITSFIINQKKKKISLYTEQAHPSPMNVTKNSNAITGTRQPNIQPNTSEVHVMEIYCNITCMLNITWCQFTKRYFFLTSLSVSFHCSVEAKLWDFFGSCQVVVLVPTSGHYGDMGCTFSRKIPSPSVFPYRLWHYQSPFQMALFLWRFS